MSKSNNQQHPVEKFHFPNSHILWHNSNCRTQSLGCQKCEHFKMCGGLSVEASIFDCLTFCRCVDPTTCDNVCPRNLEHFVARSMEIQGFSLSNIPNAPVIPCSKLPHLVPMIYHSSARTRTPAASTVALSLYEIINKKNGSLRFTDRQALLDHFTLNDQTNIILSGTDIDRSLERWWELADPESIIQGIKKLGVKLVTTPNFSLFDDVPRHDNMYNMKRIARTWWEIQRQNIACALHLNARTNRDWERWIDFLEDHPEVSHVAFEFGTGAGAKNRIKWHIEQLQLVAQKINRPIHLITRGGLKEVNTLSQFFSDVTVIETGAFVRAQKRKRVIFTNGKLGWEHSPTLENEPIDELLDANILAMQEYINSALIQANTS